MMVGGRPAGKAGASLEKIIDEDIEDGGLVQKIAAGSRTAGLDGVCLYLVYCS